MEVYFEIEDEDAHSPGIEHWFRSSKNSDSVHNLKGFPFMNENCFRC